MTTKFPHLARLGLIRFPDPLPPPPPPIKQALARPPVVPHPPPKPARGKVHGYPLKPMTKLPRVIRPHDKMNVQAKSHVTCKSLGIPFGFRMVNGTWRRVSWLKAHNLPVHP